MIVSPFFNKPNIIFVYFKTANDFNFSIINFFRFFAVTLDYHCKNIYLKKLFTIFTTTKNTEKTSTVELNFASKCKTYRISETKVSGSRARSRPLIFNQNSSESHRHEKDVKAIVLRVELTRIGSV